MTISRISTIALCEFAMMCSMHVFVAPCTVERKVGWKRREDETVPGR